MHYPDIADASVIERSNDGRLVLSAESPGWSVSDVTDTHVEAWSAKRVVAEAFIRGYDYREYLNRPSGKKPLTAQARALYEALHAALEAHNFPPVADHEEAEYMEAMENLTLGFDYIDSVLGVLEPGDED